MKKKYLSYLTIPIICILMITSLMGCESKDVTEKAPKEKASETEARDLKFCFPDGVPSLTVAKLAKENPEIDKDVTIDYEMQNAPDLLVAKVLKGEADIAIVPSNIAAQTYNKNLGYTILGTSTWGTMYLTTTEDIDSFEDLKGKEIYTFGRGLTPDLVLRYVLSNNEIDPDEDVKMTYLNSAAEVGPAFLSDKTNLAVLPEPLLSTVMTKKEEAEIVLDLNEEWAKATGSGKGFPQSSLIIKTELIDEDIDFVEKFIEHYDMSRTWAIENQEELAEYADELEISVENNIISKGIRWTNPEDFKIKDSIKAYETYYDAILDFAPDFIGGEMPGGELYFKR